MELLHPPRGAALDGSVEGIDDPAHMTTPDAFASRHAATSFLRIVASLRFAAFRAFEEPLAEADVFGEGGRALELGARFGEAPELLEEAGAASSWYAKTAAVFNVQARSGRRERPGECDCPTPRTLP